MNTLLLTFMCLDVSDEIADKWHAWALEDSLRDVRGIAGIITMLLCILSLAVVMLVVAKILEKKNDYGDEDEMHMRRDKSSSGSVNAKVISDLASGSINCMKNFHYQDISKR